MRKGSRADGKVGGHSFITAIQAMLLASIYKYLGHCINVYIYLGPHVITTKLIRFDSLFFIKIQISE